VVSRVLPGVDVLFLDTGYHFTETVGTRDAVAATMDVTVVDVTPELSLAEQDERYGPDLWSRDPAARRRRFNRLTLLAADVYAFGAQVFQCGDDRIGFFVSQMAAFARVGIEAGNEDDRFGYAELMAQVVFKNAGNRLD